jgi:hypothetical protein
MKNFILLLALLVSFNSIFPKSIFEKSKVTSLNINNMDFVLACSAGLIEGCEVIRKFGVNGNLTSGVKRDLWDFGAADAGNIDYTYPVDGTAPINTISSSNALDQQDVTIGGLDINGTKTIQTVTLNGQTKATLTTPLWRVYRMINSDVTNQADRTIGFNGNVYLYEDTAITAGVPDDPSKVKGYIFDGNNQTQMALYTIPKGFTGYIIGGSVKMTKKQSAAVVYQTWFRQFGSVFRLIDTSALNSVGTGVSLGLNPIPQMIPEKTDIVLAAESDTNATGTAGSFSILLLDNTIFKL